MVFSTHQSESAIGIHVPPPSCSPLPSPPPTSLSTLPPLRAVTEHRLQVPGALTCFIAAAAKSLQLCPTLRDPIDGSPPGSPVPGPWDSLGKNTGVGCHFLLQCLKVKSESEVAQSCLTSSDPMDCSPPGSTVHGIFQARVLEWVAIAFSGFIVTSLLFIGFLIHSMCLAWIT